MQCLNVWSVRGGRLATWEQVSTSIANINAWSLEAIHEIVKFERGRLATSEKVNISIANIKAWS